MAEKRSTALIFNYEMPICETIFRRFSNGHYFFIICETNEETEVFAAYGNGLIYVDYSGYAELDVILKSVGEELALLSDQQYFTSCWRLPYNKTDMS